MERLRYWVLFSLEKRVLTATFQHLKGAYKRLFTGARSVRTRGMVLNWKRVVLDYTVENYLPWGWWGIGIGCPQRLGMPQPWKCTIPGWMELSATWSIGRCPWPWQGDETRQSVRSLPNQTKSNPSMILFWPGLSSACLLSDSKHMLPDPVCNQSFFSLIYGNTACTFQSNTACQAALPLRSWHMNSYLLFSPKTSEIALESP